VNDRLLRNTFVLSVLGSIGAVAVALSVGQLKSGVALAIGLLVGSANGLLVKRSLALGMAFTALSLARLLLLTMLGLGIGLLIGLQQVWLVVLGIAIAQLLLAGFAFREALAR
jgi:hypothetical protein